MYKIVYDLNGVTDIYGYAFDAAELRNLCVNCIEDGILIFRVERD